MTEAKSTRTVSCSRIFPEIQWTEEQKAQWKAGREAFYQRGNPISPVSISQRPDPRSNVLFAIIFFTNVCFL